MRRFDLQQIAQSKIDDAKLLLRENRSSNAYYLAGYAVEVGLKACIARQISAETIPELSFIRSVYEHDLQKLVRVAGLSARLRQTQNENARFATNWVIVCEWAPDVRYTTINFATAQLMLAALIDETDGVLSWIRGNLVTSGQTLVRLLDTTSARPRFAMWVNLSEADSWKLWIVPARGMNDKRNFYMTVADTISRHRDELPSFDIGSAEFKQDTKPVIEGMKSFISMPGVGSANISGNSFNGVFLPEGILIRSDL